MDYVCAVMRKSSQGILFVLIGVGCLFGAGTAGASDPVSIFDEPPRAAELAPVAKDPRLEALHLTGISLVGDVRSFNIYDTQGKKSYWIRKDEAFDGFKVVGYDAATQSVTVQSPVTARIVPLRHARIVAVSPTIAAPAAVVVPPPFESKIPAHVVGVDELKNPKTPAEIKQAEYEARMMVSDLLEISMQERARQKALRDAQKNGQTVTTPPPAQTAAP